MQEKEQDPVYDDKNESDSSSKLDSDDNEDEKLFPSYDNMEVLTEKHMPIPKRVKKSLLISPLPTNTKTSSPVQKLSLNFVSGVFKDWITEDTLKFLLGEKHVYGIKADHLFEKMTSDAVNSEKLSAIKNEYINLCIKIDNLPDTDVSDSSDLDDVLQNKPSKKTSVKKNVDQSSAKKVFKKRPKRQSKEKKSDITSISEALTVKKDSSCIQDNSVSETSAVKKNMLSAENKPISEVSVEEGLQDKPISKTSGEKKDTSCVQDNSVSDTSTVKKDISIKNKPISEISVEVELQDKPVLKTSVEKNIENKPVTKCEPVSEVSVINILKFIIVTVQKV